MGPFLASLCFRSHPSPPTLNLGHRWVDGWVDGWMACQQPRESPPGQGCAVRAFVALPKHRSSHLLLTRRRLALYCPILLFVEEGHGIQVPSHPHFQTCTTFYLLSPRPLLTQQHLRLSASTKHLRTGLLCCCHITPGTERRLIGPLLPVNEVVRHNYLCTHATANCKSEIRTALLRHHERSDSKATYYI